MKLIRCDHCKTECAQGTVLGGTPGSQSEPSVEEGDALQQGCLPIVVFVGATKIAELEDVCPVCQQSLQAQLLPILDHRCQNDMGVAPNDPKSLVQLEKDHILMVVKMHPTKTEAARVLGIERSTLDRKLRKYANESS